MGIPRPPMPPLPWPMPGFGPVGASGAVPVGTVLAFAGDAAQQATPLREQGYLVCDGSVLLVSEYPDLFAAIGYIYSPSAGGGSFRLPDLQGAFLRGVDPKGAVDPDTPARVRLDGTKGAIVGSVQASALQRHQHDYTPGSPSGATAVGDKGTVGAGTAQTGPPVQGTGPKPPSTSTETRPVNTYVYFIIRYAR